MNVNKRIGKWRQWTGEKLGQQAKTELSEDFQELQEDVSLRRSGVDKLYNISKDVSKYLGKKIEFEDSEDGKASVQDAYGSVFAAHGDEFGADSAFGQALRLFGRAHQDIDKASKDYQDHFNREWLSSLERDLAAMNEYDAQCKKLGSRRLTYDAMLGKVQKSKKEKADLEADLRLARNRYEETTKDVQERAMAIQTAEAEQLAAVTSLFEAEYAFIERYKQILDDLKAEWPERLAQSRAAPERRSRAPTMTQSFSEPGAPRSTMKSRQSGHAGRGDSDEDAGDEDSRSKPGSIKNRSRSSTLTSKIKSTSAAASTEELSKPSSRFGGIRIPGLPGSSKDYASVQDEEQVSPSADLEGRHRKDSLPPSLRRTRTAPAADKSASRLVEAKWEYRSAEPDELELLPGDRIVVLSEINADWYTGRSQRTGHEAMFPSAFVVPVVTSPAVPPRALPARKQQFPPTPPEEPAAYMEPQTTGQSDVSDAFADPHHSGSSHLHSDLDDDEDESENAALRPNGGPAFALSDRSPSSNALSAATRGVARRIPSLPASSSGKKPPPPPPPARRAHSSYPAVPASPADDAAEAYGNVSELKKRLGMGK